MSKISHGLQLLVLNTCTTLLLNLIVWGIKARRSFVVFKQCLNSVNALRKNIRNRRFQKKQVYIGNFRDTWDR